MPLPAGKWKANVNGTEGALSIEAPNQQGLFTGNLFGSNAITGLWDEVSQTITFPVFLTIAFVDNIPAIALFKGYLFRSPPNPEPGRDVVAMLTGSIQVTPGSIVNAPFPAVPTSRRNVFGWTAEITELV